MAAGGRVGTADRAAGYPWRSISRPRVVPPTPPDSAYQAAGHDKVTEGYTGGGMGVTLLDLSNCECFRSSGSSREQLSIQVNSVSMDRGCCSVD